MLTVGWMLFWVPLPCRCTGMHTGSSVYVNEDGGPAVRLQVTRSLSGGLRLTGCVLCLLQLQPLPAGRAPHLLWMPFKHMILFCLHKHPEGQGKEMSLGS